MSENDIVADIIQRLADSMGADLVPPEVMQRLEVEIRRDWAGNICYIQAATSRTRNAEIRKRYRNGHTVDRLAAAYSLTPRRIRQIVNRK